MFIIRVKIRLSKIKKIKKTKKKERIKMKTKAFNKPSRLDLFPCLSGSIRTARARQFAYLILCGCWTTTLAAVPT